MVQGPSKRSRGWRTLAGFFGGSPVLLNRYPVEPPVEILKAERRKEPENHPPGFSRKNHLPNRGCQPWVFRGFSLPRKNEQFTTQKMIGLQETCPFEMVPIFREKKREISKGYSKALTPKTRMGTWPLCSHPLSLPRCHPLPWSGTAEWRRTQNPKGSRVKLITRWFKPWLFDLQFGGHQQPVCHVFHRPKKVTSRGD